MYTQTGYGSQLIESPAHTLTSSAKRAKPKLLIVGARQNWCKAARVGLGRLLIFDG
jgi:hypothetical protein